MAITDIFKSKKKAQPKTQILVAAAPKGKVIAVFKATKTFDSPEMKSTYCKGMVYKVREGNTRLLEMARDWRDSGWVNLEE